MKKNFALLVAIITLIELIGVFLFVFYLMDISEAALVKKSDTASFMPKTQEEKMKYNVRATIDVEGHNINVTEELTFKTAAKVQHAYLPSVNKAKTSISKISSDQEISDWSQSDTNLSIISNEPFKNITIEYSIIPEPFPETIAINDKNILLTNFLLTPAVSKAGNTIMTYSSKLGDPYIYEIFNYYIVFSANQSLNIYGPGIKEEHLIGDNRITIFDASNIRDFSVFMSSNAKITAVKHKNIEVLYINSDDLKDSLDNVFEFAECLIGPYPYNRFIVVQTPIPLSGMEHSGMILINSAENNINVKKNILYHEVFHQWFYGIIGTDQLNEPFLDEGMVTYLTSLYTNSTSVKVGGQNFFGRKLKDYSSDFEYHRLAYLQASDTFLGLHQNLNNNFYQLLKDVYNKKKFQIMYYSDFCKIANKYSGRR